jgi:predicted dehydrogenase
MASSHADTFAKIDGVDMVAAVDIDPARAKVFAAKYGIGHTFTSLEEAIAWGKFDAAANVTPDKAHYPTTMALIAAGKHVFCEKPLAENYEKAAEMAAAAERSGLVAMVNLTYRNVAPLQKARALVLSGEIGRLRHLEASYLQSWLVSKAWGDWASESKWLWRLSTKHGSNGVLGDVGIHILDFAGYGAASTVERVFARLKAFDKAPGNRIGEYVLDANDSFAMTVELENGAMGVIHASRWATGHLNELRLRLHGDKGALEVIHTPDGSSLRACLGADVEEAVWRDVDAGTVPTNYERFAAAVEAGRTVEPGFRHAADLQKVLDLAIETERARRELTA